MLGASLVSHECELRADLMRFYHVSLDQMGEAYSYRDAACMVSYLPTESALMRAIGDGWSETERLLAEVAENVAIVWWQRIDHSKPGADKPPRVYPPHERALMAKRRSEQTTYTKSDMDEIAERLGIPEDRR